ncbi:heterokaryon incompatibility protein-domain-containing protein, partial [Phyllosticta capitalensis]
MSYECSYTELPTPSTIRLIELEENKVNETFACVIYYVDCAQSEWTHLEYNALSYVWGDSRPTRHIYLIGSTDEMYPVSVHENLWRFLAWAWEKGLHKGSYIWTDRICLNQHNDDEMAQRVPRMGEIFRNATRVFAWLGMSEHQGQHLKPFLDLYRDGEDPREHPCAPETPLAVAAIANNEYWTRVWILQEFALAKQVV